MITGKNWYVVYTKPKCERNVASLIQQNGIEAFCPVVKSWKRWSDRKKLVEEVLFNSYVFVNASVADIALIRQISGVVNFVYWLNRPAIIKEEEIRYIKEFTSGQVKQNIYIEKAVVNINETVKVLDGPFMNKEGNVIEIKNKTVKLYLPSLGYNLVVEFEKSNIQSLTLKPQLEHSLVVS